MKDIKKYQGVIPAFYACYDAEGNISVEGVKALTRHLIAKGVKGVYVGGSSGECIYQHPDERKAVLEAVMSEAKGKITVIAHVACNNTADSVELAAHAEKCGVDAIASIPPIYFHLPNYAIADYWNAMSAAAPNTEFVIYNIPQLAGVALSPSLFKKMRENPNVIGVKNSSMPVQDIQMFKAAGGEGALAANNYRADDAGLDFGPLARFVFLRPFLPVVANAANAFLGAVPIIREGISELFKGRLNVAVLDASALIVSLLRRDFKTAGLLVLLLGMGEMLENYARRKSMASKFSCPPLMFGVQRPFSRP